ncbi:hypothetical protein EHQ94_02085 [Leptospira meyeri]|uniref:hypothetical protein n=1 Tax=Leptospira meyeri TaxID=29508 RepID=UPI001083682B|nr:hypothetical protein [Leptospira meyeri]TGM65849.1 hypothetical protein EHQ93_08865 [Leptospira meyeri]TGM72061.1 hypothetical protein EHQ94_02085 [Leptospira meyeri]
MKKEQKKIKYYTIIILIALYINSCYSITETKIPKEREAIPNSEVFTNQYSIELNNDLENVLVSVKGNKILTKKVKAKYIIDRSSKFKDNPSCVEVYNIFCIFPLFLEIPTLIWRTWNSEITEIETETASEKGQIISVDDLKINICGKKYPINNGKLMIQSDSCKDKLEDPHLIDSNGKIIVPTTITPDLISVYEKIQSDKEEAKREKELYSRPHYWLYCSTTGYSSMHPAVTNQFLQSMKLIAYDESLQCENAAWAKNQMAMQMGIGCICKFMKIDKSQADKLNNR